jgi:hydrogenase nickel incorporation protein HypA/HybF
MHEFSLVDGVVKQLKTSAAGNGIKEISKVALVVGQMTMAVPDSLQFAFEILRREEPLLKDDAVLEIREEPVVGECKDCQHRYEIQNWEFLCPACSSANIKLVGGRELYIDYYEGE